MAKSTLFFFCLILLFMPFSHVRCADAVKQQDALLKPTEPYGGDIRRLDNGKQIWLEHASETYDRPVKRDHVFSNLPELLKGKGYILSPFEYSEALVEEEGYVYVITPTPVEAHMGSGRYSSKSAAGSVVPYFRNLPAQGFELMEDIPEFKISETVEETVAVYRKYAKKGDTIRYGKHSWGVTIGRLPSGYDENKEAEPKTVQLVKTPSTIYFQPGQEYAYSSRTYQAIPGIEVTPKGRLWATWVADNTGDYTEGPRNFLVIVTSGDGGKTWSDPPQLAIQHPAWPVASIDAVPWKDPSGRMWLFWTQCDVLMGKHDSWAMSTENPDAEKPSWSKPMGVGRGTLLNKPTVLSTGEWLLPSSPRGNPVDVYISKDKGKTVSHFSEATVPNAGWNEHMIIERKDGSLWMLVRSWAPRSGISQTSSLDRGKTWSQGELFRPGPSTRFHIRRLKSGRLLLIYHPLDPETPGRRNKMTAYLSEDEGKTWPYELLLYGGNCSYPDATESDDGVIYVIHDADGRKNRMNIAFSSFTEEDIMA
ncbi:MAG TPA: sialidase family protein, partial [bacterium]|nr:sialidase family protein [bacterium]